METGGFNPKPSRTTQKPELRQLASPAEAGAPMPTGQDERLELVRRHFVANPQPLAGAKPFFIRWATSAVGVRSSIAYVEGGLKSHTRGRELDCGTSQEEEFDGRCAIGKGTLIINGDWAGLVLGRANPQSPAANQLRDPGVPVGQGMSDFAASLLC